MTGWWLVSHIVMWLILIALVALVVGILRMLGQVTAALRINPRESPLRAPSIETIGPRIGARFENFRGSSRSRAGERWVTETFEGREGVNTLAVFMTPNCRGCQDIAGDLNRVAARRRDVQTVIVMKGDQRTCTEFADLFDVAVPVFADEGGAITQKFAVNANPFGLLYDPTQTLLRKGVFDNDTCLRALLGEIPISLEMRAYVFPVGRDAAGVLPITN